MKSILMLYFNLMFLLSFQHATQKLQQEFSFFVDDSLKHNVFITHLDANF